MFLGDCSSKMRGPSPCLCGRCNGICGSLLELDSEEETDLFCEAETHKLLHVRLDQMAVYMGDLSDFVSSFCW